ncbi:MAG: M15 family metallopeptidase [Micrococcaceae bacterium]|nr:M15 family metallopeptidase [Micrococcaceae bacterium]
MMTTPDTLRRLPAVATSIALAAAFLLPAATAQASPVGDLQSTQATPSSAATAEATPGKNSKSSTSDHQYAAYSTDPASPLVLVNKDHPLQPRDYAPKDLVSVSGNGTEMVPRAAKAMKKLIAGGARDGQRLTVISAYRSYDHQLALFQRYTRKYGKDYAARISAKPGTSEHQLGLSADVGAASGQCALKACLADLPSGKWIAAHAADYGFIVRYPQDEHETTGYNFEPWHLRYVGTKAAQRMDQQDMATFEEYSDQLVADRKKQKSKTAKKEAAAERQAAREKAARDAEWERQERRAEETRWWPDWARSAFTE